MSLRLKLVFALTLTALLPMAVVVGVPMLRAERTAQQEAAQRLDRTCHQAQILVGRHARDASARLEQAALALARDEKAGAVLLRGPDADARAIMRELADSHDLDHLEILNPDGTVLAASRMEVSSGTASALADLEQETVVLRALAEVTGGGSEVMAHLSRRPVSVGHETLWLAGGLFLDDELLREIAEISGEPVMLLNPEGTAEVSATAGTAPGERLTGDVALGDGKWKLRLSVPAGDLQRARRELWVTFAGVAPLALMSALGLGVLLAHGVTRPIRVLADRAERIWAAHSRPLQLLPETDEVRRLTTAFDGMLEALTASERERVAAERVAAWQEVAKRIAHEVKNPLSPIKLAVENLRRTRAKAPQELDRALEEETSTILEEVESLRRLVDEFSQFARLPSPQRVRCDLRQLVAQALALYATRIREAEVKVDWPQVQEPLWATVDPEQIGRVLKNVLSNALDALEPVSDRRLSLLVRLAPGGVKPAAEIQVHDQGVGFEPEALRRVFEPYFTTRAARGGSGLGMSIAHRIVTEHGGTIQVRGAPGQGATILIRLPMEPITGR